MARDNTIIGRDNTIIVSNVSLENCIYLASAAVGERARALENTVSMQQLMTRVRLTKQHLMKMTRAGEMWVSVSCSWSSPSLATRPALAASKPDNTDRLAPWYVIAISFTRTGLV